MGNRRSGFKRLEEEHECTPASDWTKEEQESETKGKPVPEANTTVVAAANSAANPLLGVNSVMFLPTVSITL